MVVTSLHHQLRQGQVGRGEPEKGDAGDQARSAHQGERRQAVVLGLPGRCKGADAAHHPEQREDRRDSGSIRRVAPLQAA